MCNKKSPPPSPSSSPSDVQTNSVMKTTQKKATDSSSPKPARRRNRTKTRKPKFLSLRLQLSPNPSLSQSQNQPNRMTHHDDQHQPQLNLFPLHAENLVDDRDMHEEHNVALLFSSDGGATLNGLLEVDSTTTTTTTTTTTGVTSSEEDSFSPPSLTCPFGVGGGDNGTSLVRKAMRRRSKERDDGSEERWVCYSEVVEKTELMEEVTSYCAATAATEDPFFWCDAGSRTTTFGLLSLKLDYQGILNAWSDKGPLYVAEEAPQTVPDLLRGVLPHNAANVAVDGWESDAVGNTWKVPEDYGGNKMAKVKEEMGWKAGQREASVLRYKEKRQSRLFSKRIRYEVRKLNAEKRPRMKGRFVKRE